MMGLSSRSVLGTLQMEALVGGLALGGVYMSLKIAVFKMTELQ